MKSILANHLDTMILCVLLLALFAAAYGAVAWLEAGAGILLAFVMPGWLVVRLLFGERPFELEVEVLLVLFISAFLMAMEVLVLIYFRVLVERTLLQILAAGTDVVLLIILKIRQGMRASNSGAPRHVNWPSLLAAVFVPLALYGFGLFHIHETRESFTEFYVETQPSVDTVLLVVESREERNQFFTLVCTSQESERAILGNFELSPGEIQQITILYRQYGLREGRLRLALDQHKGEEDYRWVEIPGRDCEDLDAVFE